MSRQYFRNILRGIATTQKVSRRSRAIRRRVDLARPSRLIRYESLEDRDMLTTTLFLDFGAGIGMGNFLNTTVADFRNIDGPGLNGFGTGSDLTSRLGSSGSLDFTPLAYDFNGDSLINNGDISALADAVVPLVQRALEPFDILVQVATAASLADAVTTLHLNDGDSSGQNDAYSWVIAAFSDAIGGGSVGDTLSEEDFPWADGGDGFGLFGIAAGDDLFTQTGNNQDEAALTFSDFIMSQTTGTPGTALFNQNLAQRLAYTATHEAFHTFSYVHTADGGNLSNGDVIRNGASVLARESPFIVTRFDLTHQSIPVSEPDNYLLAVNDPDIGLRDSDFDGTPDLAYITGTGAFDRITVTLDNVDPTKVNVVVDAFNNRTSAFANPPTLGSGYLGTNSYSIDLTSDTEGLILIDSSLSDDRIIVDARIPASFKIRTNTGNDRVDLVGNGASALGTFEYFGEVGNDEFFMDFRTGDPLPAIGNTFNFVGGSGTDNALVIEASGTQRTAYFVDTLADAADASIGNGRADSNAGLADDQITLRAALQEAGFTGTPAYVFVPAGAITLTYDGPDAGTAPDPLSLGNVTIMGPGANLLTVSGNNQTQVFTAFGTGAISGLTVTAGSGGGISSTGNLTLDRVAVENNSGSGITSSAGTLVVANSTIANNAGASNGGGLTITGGATTITNSTISGNSVIAVGGGIFFQNGSLQVINSTITANRAWVGSGIYSLQPALLHNTIVANNLAGSGGPTTDDLSGSFNVASSYNLIGVGGLTHGVNGNIVLGAGVSAGLSTLGYYGGPMRTHKLLSTSAAIDAGDNAVAIAYSLNKDQRGLNRIVDWNGVGGDRVDIGAVELAFGEM
jgi:hypothetical protein